MPTFLNRSNECYSLKLNREQIYLLNELNGIPWNLENKLELIMSRFKKSTNSFHLKKKPVLKIGQSWQCHLGKILDYRKVSRVTRTCVYNAAKQLGIKCWGETAVPNRVPKSTNFNQEILNFINTHALKMY